MTIAIYCEVTIVLLLNGYIGAVDKIFLLSFAHSAIGRIMQFAVPAVPWRKKKKNFGNQRLKNFKNIGFIEIFCYL